MTELKDNNMEQIKEQYQYKLENNEELIIDKPSKPLTKKNKSKDIDTENIKVKVKVEVEDDVEEVNVKEVNVKEVNVEDVNVKVQKIEKKIMKDEIKSNKEIYESYIKDLKYFSLTINNVVLYDSSIDKNVISPLIFDNNYFILYGKKYSYNGLKIQKINKK